MHAIVEFKNFLIFLSALGFFKTPNDLLFAKLWAGYVIGNRAYECPRWVRQLAGINTENQAALDYFLTDILQGE